VWCAAIIARAVTHIWMESACHSRRTGVDESSRREFIRYLIDDSRNHDGSLRLTGLGKQRYLVYQDEKAQVSHWLQLMFQHSAGSYRSRHVNHPATSFGQRQVSTACDKQLIAFLIRPPQASRDGVRPTVRLDGEIYVWISQACPSAVSSWLKHNRL
jgi:hypothetical protein